MKIIAHRKELFALEDATNGFHTIGLCTKLNDYEKLNKISYKLYEANNKSKYTGDEWKGLVIGEPFLNYWLYKMGSTYGISFEGISTRTEDGHGVDAWVRDSITDERCAVNHKMFGYSNMVLREHTAGIAWASLRYKYRPVLVTTSAEVSIPVKSDIEATRGIVITRDNIEPLVDNQSFWKNFQEYLLLNYSDYKQKQQIAVIEAAARATRPLEPWQVADLAELLK